MGTRKVQPFPTSRKVNDFPYHERSKYIAPEDLDIRRVRVLKSNAIEEAVVIWVLQMQHIKQPINGPLIVEKAKQFGEALGKLSSLMAGFMRFVKEMGFVSLKFMEKAVMWT